MIIERTEGKPSRLGLGGCQLIPPALLLAQNLPLFRVLPKVRRPGKPHPQRSINLPLMQPAMKLPTRTRMSHNYGGGVLITPKLRLAACKYARKTSCDAAEIKFGVSSVNIAKWMKALGIPRRRACCPTLKEAERYSRVA